MLEPMSKTIDQDFCPACGTILPLADGSSILQCLLCKKTQDVRIFHGAQSSVRINFQGRSDEEVSGGNDDGATIERKCSRCGNDEMFYTTRQLRSADEGQTVFFRCPKCGFKESENS